VAYKDTVRDLGNHVKIGPNTKGTGTRGTVMPDLAETKVASAEQTPVKLSTTGNSVGALRDLGKRRKVKTRI
jgi:hypothetical protein